MRVIAWRVAFVLFVLVSALFVAYGMREYHRAVEEARMDSRELRYDADDLFILIDTGEGLMGVYRAVKPLRHIWQERLKRIKPGLYKLDICDGWVELYNDEMRGCYVIDLGDDDSKFFLKRIEQGTTTLVY